MTKSCALCYIFRLNGIKLEIANRIYVSYKLMSVHDFAAYIIYRHYARSLIALYCRRLNENITRTLNALLYDNSR